MAKTYKDNNKINVTETKQRKIERKDRYIEDNHYYISELLEMNPKIKFAYLESIGSGMY